MPTTTADKARDSVLAILRLGTRTSQLALWQSRHVAAQLQHHWPNLTCEFVHHVTQGDKRLDRPLPEIGGKGLFTAELEDALRRGEIDIAVHSLKDLPVEDAPDLTIGAILSREDTRDVLVSRERWTLATLPQGAVVGTSSLRRQAQLLALRPDLQVRSIRGNVDTRIRKVMSGDYDAAILAGAGLVRLGLTEHILEWLPLDLMLPAPGQGALAVQCRANDPGVHELLAAIHDPHAATATLTERRLLFRLGGGCSAPVGARAEIAGDQISLVARVASKDGQQVFNARGSGNDPDQVAEQVARALLGQGARVALSRELPQSTLPLAGKRIAVTRPARSAGEARDELAVKLAQMGAEAVELPLIRLVPMVDPAQLAQVIEQLPQYAWIIFTSANAVDHLFAAVETHDLQPQWSQTHLAAVGPATRATLVARGLTVSTMPEQYLGSEVIEALGDVAGKRILLPRSAQGSGALPDELRERGALVDEIALYTPEEVPLDEQAQAQFASVDVITFASGSAVRAFANAMQRNSRLAEIGKHVVVACIGPSTAEAAHVEGLPVHIVAAEHTVSGLVAALVAHFQPELKDA